METYPDFVLGYLFVAVLSAALAITRHRIGDMERRLAVLEDRVRPKASDDELDYGDLFGQE